ncbi:hypothetical protein [Helicobacter sp. 23-1045]
MHKYFLFIVKFKVAILAKKSQNLWFFRARFCDLNHILDSALFRRIYA